MKPVLSKQQFSALDEEEYQSLIQDLQQSQVFDPKHIQKNRRKLTILLMMLSFISGCLTTYFVTFFPIYSRSSNKQLHDKLSIWIINFVQISIFVMFPFQESLLQKFGKKKYIVYGVIILIITDIGVGLMDLINDRDFIFYEGVMTRFLQGIGICMIQTACYSLTCVLFDDEKLKYMGYIQSCIGTGEVVGPFLGSCLFKYFGFFAQFLYLDVFLILLMYLTIVWLPERKNTKSMENSNMFSQCEEEFSEEELSAKLYSSKRIILDFIAFCINITLDNCFIGFFPIVLHTLFHLDQQTIGLLFALRGITYVIASWTLPFFDFPPKLQNIFGLFLQTVSLILIGTSSLLKIPNQLNIICLGLTLQGIASPFIAISVMPSVLDRFQVEYNLNPEIHNRAYSNLCDKVGNVIELCYAGFFLISSIAGEYLNDYKGSDFTFNLFIGVGFVTTILYFFIDCGFNCYLEHKDFRQKLQRINFKILKTT